MSKTIGRRNLLWQSANLVALVGISLASCSAASKNDINSQSQTKVQTMKFESDAFAANSKIPVKYTCDGESISPPLKWGEPPSQTKSIALIVDDPDAPNGTFVHWVFYNLPPQTRNLPPAIPTTAKVEGGIQGKNGRNDFGYTGPCPPNGTHRYFFKLYALDTVLNLDPGATKDKLQAAMEHHILATAEFIGLYQRQSQ